jgi:uncharacterized membrane protein
LLRESISLWRRKNKLNKRDFLNHLEGSLRGINYEDKKDIIYDYEEHFSVGLEQGKSEEEICQNLGDPKVIAKQFRANYMVDKAKNDTSAGNIIRAVVAVISLGFFNIVFVLGPFLGVVGVLIGVFAAALGVFLAGLGVLLGGLASSFMPIFFINLHPLAMVFSAIGLMCMGTLIFIGACCLGKLIYILTVKYLQLNLNIIKKGEA